MLTWKTIAIITNVVMCNLIFMDIAIWYISALSQFEQSCCDCRNFTVTQLLPLRCL